MDPTLQTRRLGKKKPDRDWPFDCFTRTESGTCVCLRSETFLFLQLLVFPKAQPSLSSHRPVGYTRQPEDDCLGGLFSMCWLAERSGCGCGGLCAQESPSPKQGRGCPAQDASPLFPVCPPLTGPHQGLGAIIECPRG